jgi:hypothetical protein
VFAKVVSERVLQMYPGTSDSLLEKREYPDGVRYVPATSVVAGVSYYVQRKDEQGHDYYLNTNPTPVMSNVAYQPTQNPVQATYAPQVRLLRWTILAMEEISKSKTF